MYGNNCKFVHDKNEIVEHFNKNFSYINEKYYVPNYMKLYIVNIKNYDIVTKYKHSDISILLLLIAHLIITYNECALYNKVFTEFSFTVIKDILKAHIFETNDVNYLISFCILNCFWHFDCFISSRRLYKNMFKGMFISYKEKEKYAIELCSFIKENTTEQEIYKRICELNDKYVNNNKDIEYDSHSIQLITGAMYYNYNVIHSTRKYLHDDKEFFKKTVIALKDNYIWNFINSSSFIKIYLTCLSKDIKEDIKFMLEIIEIEPRILFYLDINDYVKHLNINILKDLLQKDIKIYKSINACNRTDDIIKLGCSINYIKIPYEDRVKFYSLHLNRMFIKKLRCIRNISTIISQYLNSVHLEPKIIDREICMNRRLDLMFKYRIG